MYIFDKALVVIKKNLKALAENHIIIINIFILTYNIVFKMLVHYSSFQYLHIFVIIFHCL